MKIYLTLLGFVFSLGSFGAGNSISQCNTRITQPGTYRLAKNLHCPNRNAIRIINTERVTIRMGGFYIDGSNTRRPGTGNGIDVVRSTRVRIVSSRPNAAIRDFRHGINIDHSSRVSVSNITIQSNLVGILASRSDAMSIHDNDFFANSFGAVLFFAHRSVVIGNAFDSSGTGLLVTQSNRCFVGDNTFNRFDYGIALSNTNSTFLDGNDVSLSQIAGLATFNANRTTVRGGAFNGNQCDLQVVSGRAPRTSGVSLNRCQ